MATKKKTDWRSLLLAPEWSDVGVDEDGGETTTWHSILGGITVGRFDRDSSYKWSYCFDEHYDEESFICESIEDGKQKAWEYVVSRIAPAFESAGAVP